MMKGPLLRAIENLEQPYPELYAHLMVIHDQANQQPGSKADEMRENLITALRCEEPNSPKAIKVTEAIQNLVKLYPRNEKNEEGKLICPVSAEIIDEDKPEENFYSSVSSYILKKNSAQKWYQGHLQEKNDTVNRRPLSRHELHVLRPDRNYLVAVRLLEYNDTLLNQWVEQFDLRGDEENLFRRELQKNLALYYIVLSVIAYYCYEISDRNVEVPLIVMGAGTFVALMVLIKAITERENNQGTAPRAVVRFTVGQEGQQTNETTPLITNEQNRLLNMV